MPGENQEQNVTTEKIDGIPLYLIPRAIADQIKQKGNAVFQILVTRKFQHRYTVKVETSDEVARRIQEDEPADRNGDGVE